MICENCKKEVSELTKTDLGQMCQDCVDELCNWCDKCETYQSVDDFYKVDGEYVCGKCAEDAEKCADCGNLTWEAYLWAGRRGGEPICETCADDYRECSQCGNYYRYNNVDYCDECDEYFCDDCNCSCSTLFCEQKMGVASVTTEVGEQIKIARLVGCEIESEQGQHYQQQKVNDYVPDCCGVCADGSLEHGVEVQTPPRMLVELEKVVKDTVQGLTQIGLEAQATCGLHIHLDAKDLKAKQIRNFVGLHYVLEDFIFEALPQSRTNSQFCRKLSTFYSLNRILRWRNFADIERAIYLSDTIRKELYNLAIPYHNTEKLEELENIANQIWHIKTKKPILSTLNKDYKAHTVKLKAERYNSKRYMALNLHSYFYRGTIELRHHSGTLQAEKILNWIDLNLRLLDFAKTVDTSIIRYLYKLPNSQRFDTIARLADFPPELTKYWQARRSKFKTQNN